MKQPMNFQKIKVMQVIPLFRMGGAETLVKDYCLKLHNLGLDVVVLCFERTGSKYEQLLEENNIKIRFLSDECKNHSLNPAGRLKKYFEKARVIRKIIIEEKPDVVHGHLRVNFYLYFANIPKNIKIFYTVHNELKKNWDMENCYLPNKLELFAIRRMMRQRRFSFIALHTRMKSELKKVFKGAKVYQLNNGIDFSRFQKDFDDIKLRESLGISGNDFVVGHVGSFIEAKNHNFIVDVFHAYHQKNPDSKLLLIGGEGILFDSIKNKIDRMGLSEKTVVLLNRTDIPELLSIMDCFLFPSLFEGFPIALIEAQAAGKRCIISDRITDEVLLTPQIVKLSIEDGPEKWADEIDILHENAGQKGVERYDMDGVIKRLLRIYMG